MPLIAVGNLSQTLESLKKAGFWCLGLDGAASESLGEALDGLSRPGKSGESAELGRLALVLGAEGKGLRRLTAEHCDRLARIPIRAESVESLNISNAAAIVLYEIARRS